MQQKLLFLYCGLLFILIFVGFFHPIQAINEDLGRHLLLGEVISHTGRVPATNLLSYTYPHYPFINSHWLSEVIFYQLVRGGGFPLLLITTTFVTIISFTLVFVFSAKRYSLSVSAFAATALVPILLRRSEIRPEVFSFFFEALFLYILFSYRSRFSQLIYILIPLQVLWANMHIYFVAGIILLVLFFVDSLITHRFRFDRSVRTLGIVLSLSLIGCFINPNGWSGVLHPMIVLQHYGMPVLENQSVFVVKNPYHLLQISYSLLVIGILPLVLFLNRKKTAFIDWLIVGVFSVLALTAVRNAPLFTYAVYIPLAGALSALLPKISNKLTKTFSSEFRNTFHFFALSLLIALVVLYALYVASLRSFGFGLPEKSQGAADFFLANKLRGPIYNDYNTGNYFAYRFYPQEKVFVDGRPEAYPEAFFHDVYLPMQTDPKKFAEAIAIYQFNTIIISDSKLVPIMNNVVSFLKAHKAYVLVYEDTSDLIFVKKIDAHTEVIRKFAKP